MHLPDWVFACSGIGMPPLTMCVTTSFVTTWFIFMYIRIISWLCFICLIKFIMSKVQKHQNTNRKSLKMKVYFTITVLKINAYKFIWKTNLFFIWVLRPFQEYINYIEPIVHQRWAKTREPGEKTPDHP